jgi:hypothetical protein
MEPELAKILDDCIDRINDDSSIEVCLAYHPQIRKELEPLLYTSKTIFDAGRIKPSEEFRKTAKGRLMARITEEGIHESSTGWKSSLFPFLNVLTGACDGFWRALDSVKRSAVPVALTLVLILISVLSVANIGPGTSAMNAGCTLTVLNGAVDVVTPEYETGQPGVDGMTLEVGTRVITSQDSKALLTFFDGSTLIIEPGTDIEIEELAVSGEQSISIVLKQWMGKTWSRVVKMTDSGSHYEIQTPSAVAVVRGTYFSTEVDEDGETQVHTREGLVSVFGLGENEDEVFVSPGRQTTVVLGAPPCRPVFFAPETDDSQDQDDIDYLVMNNNGNAYGLDKDNNGNAYGLDKDNNGNAYGRNKGNNITDMYTWEYQYNGNALGLNKDDTSNASDLDKDNNGNAGGLDNNNGNAGGLDNNNGKGQDNNNGKAIGKDKGSDDTGIPPSLIPPPGDPEPVEDPAPGEGNDEPVDDGSDEDEDEDDEDESEDDTGTLDLPDNVVLPDQVILP